MTTGAKHWFLRFQLCVVELIVLSQDVGGDTNSLCGVAKVAADLPADGHNSDGCCQSVPATVVHDDAGQLVWIAQVVALFIAKVGERCDGNSGRCPITMPGRLHDTIQAISCQADVIGQLNSEQVLHVVPEIGLVDGGAVEADRVENLNSFRHDARLFAAADHLRMQVVIRGQNAEFGEVFVHAMHA